MISEQSIDKLKNKFRGKIILSEDPEYTEARKVYNAMIDKHPALIAKCVDTADVISVVNFARENEMLTAIRGGGHSGAGLALCDDGLVIDLSQMNGVYVDPKNRTALVEGGATWGKVDHATQVFGLATVSGVISTTGVAGLTLGGGHGYLTRKYGLTIDNLLEANIVVADGSFVTANEKENDDLFWALRGGGGNFGVVTSFKFKLNPVSVVYGGPIFYPLKQAEKVLRWYRDFLPNAPQDLSGIFGFHTIPPAPIFPKELHMKKVCATIWCYTGLTDNAEFIFKPIREVAKPVLDLTGPFPYYILQSLQDDLVPSGLQWYWKGDFIKEISDDAITKHLEFGSNLPTPLSFMHLYPVDGSVQKVDSHETAFSYRDVTWSAVYAGVDPDPANAEKLKNWATNYWKAIHPFSAGGAYVNFMMEEGQEQVKAAYRDNYKRLATIKKKYDPANMFRFNQNIKPAD